MVAEIAGLKHVDEMIVKTITLEDGSSVRGLVLATNAQVFVLTTQSKDEDKSASTITILASDQNCINNLLITKYKYNEDSGNILRLEATNPNLGIAAFEELCTLLVYLPSSKVQSVNHESSEDCLIGTGVLSIESDSEIEITSSGSGGLFIASDSKMEVESLKVQSYGSGNIQLNMQELVVQDSISINGQASGSISLSAALITADSIKTQVVGSGNIYISASTLSVDTLESSTLSSGDINYYYRGECDTHNLYIYGSGNINSGSITCQDTNAHISGSGNAYVQTVDVLTVSAESSGDVRYYNQTPDVINADKKSYPKYSKKNRFEVFSEMEPPTIDNPQKSTHIIPNIWTPFGISPNSLPSISGKNMAIGFLIWLLCSYIIRKRRRTREQRRYFIPVQ